jgi:hypothetical protein
MSPLQNQAAELASLLQLYLRQEHEIKDWISADAENHAFFKQLVQSKRRPAEPSKKVAPMIEPLAQIAPKPKLEPVKKEEPVVIVPTPQIEQPKPEEKKLAVEKKPFALEPLPKAHPIDLKDIREIITEKYPRLSILDTLPEEKITVPAVLVIYQQASSSQLTFLKNLVKAISLSLTPATLFDIQMLQRQNLWNHFLQSPNLRLIVTSGKISHSTETPILEMSDLSLYLTDPLQKQSLWKMIQSAL